MLNQCGATVYDAIPTLPQYWDNVLFSWVILPWSTAQFIHQEDKYTLHAGWSSVAININIRNCHKPGYLIELTYGPLTLHRFLRVVDTRTNNVR